MVKQHLPTPECGESRPTVTCCTHIPQVIFSGLPVVAFRTLIPSPDNALDKPPESS